MDCKHSHAEEDNCPPVMWINLRTNNAFFAKSLDLDKIVLVLDGDKIERQIESYFDYN